METKRPVLTTDQCGIFQTNLHQQQHQEGLENVSGDVSGAQEQAYSCLYEEPIDLSPGREQRKIDFINAYYSKYYNKDNIIHCQLSPKTGIEQHLAAQQQNYQQEVQKHLHQKQQVVQGQERIQYGQQPLAPIDLKFPKKRRKKSKVTYTENGEIILLDQNDIHVSFDAAKQAEILKAAQSLFSKRTRTLYQWMYPGIAKAHLKSAVSNGWDSLGKTEKELYISQVLGRFSLPQTNLMINPQLHTMKQLPPPPPHTSVHHPKRSSGELQKAISSISAPTSSKPFLTFDTYEQLNEKVRKRRRRVRGENHGHKRNFAMSGTTEDFQDDPELSQELEKFAVTFNLSNI